MPTELHDAMCYSDLMHGAQLLYNLMLAEKRGVERWLSEYQERFGDWVAASEARRGTYERCEQTDFWRRVRLVNPSLPSGAERFSQNWIARVLGASRLNELMYDADSRALIALRERTLKGAPARLESPAHLEIWGGASSAAPLDYRWPITRTIANDIIAGLGR